MCELLTRGRIKGRTNWSERMPLHVIVQKLLLRACGNWILRKPIEFLAYYAHGQYNSLRF